MVIELVDTIPFHTSGLYAVEKYRRKLQPMFDDRQDNHYSVEPHGLLTKRVGAFTQNRVGLEQKVRVG